MPPTDQTPTDMRVIKIGDDLDVSADIFKCFHCAAEWGFYWISFRVEGSNCGPIPLYCPKCGIAFHGVKDATD